jgi:hypothetical protein
VAVATKEGIAAVDDALKFLAKQQPLSALMAPGDATAAEGMRLACEDHLVDRGTTGTIGHTGGDGSSPAARYNRYCTWSGAVGECLWFGRAGATAQQIVEDLVVDDGVANRAHRLCIFDERYMVAASMIGPHKTFGSMAVIGFAASVSPLTDAEDAAEGNEQGSGSTQEGALERRRANGPPRVPFDALAKDPGRETQWGRSIGCCAGCGELIAGGSVMEVNGLGKLHKDCFKCYACLKPLAGVPFITAAAAAASPDAAKAPYCKECHAEAFAPTCAGCDKKITGAGVRVNQVPYHKECKPTAPAAPAKGSGGPSAVASTLKRGGKTPAAKSTGTQPKAAAAGASILTGRASKPAAHGQGRPAALDESLAGARAGVTGLQDLYSGLE